MQRQTEALKDDDEKWKKVFGVIKEKKPPCLLVLRGCSSGEHPAGSVCLFSLWQDFSSPEVTMASFLAEIRKEQEILWLSFERWLYYWDTANEGWCRPGIPHLAPPFFTPHLKSPFLSLTWRRAAAFISMNPSTIEETTKLIGFFCVC